MSDESASTKASNMMPLQIEDTNLALLDHGILTVEQAFDFISDLPPCITETRELLRTARKDKRKEDIKILKTMLRAYKKTYQLSLKVFDDAKIRNNMRNFMNGLTSRK